MVLSPTKTDKPPSSTDPPDKTAESSLPNRACELCRHRVFIMVDEQHTLVDYSQEGAIEGHPLIQRQGTIPIKIRCAACYNTVEHNEAEQMRKEII